MLPQVFPILPGCFDSEYWTVADVLSYRSNTMT